MAHGALLAGAVTFVIVLGGHILSSDYGRQFRSDDSLTSHTEPLLDSQEGRPWQGHSGPQPHPLDTQEAFGAAVNFLTLDTQAHPVLDSQDGQESFATIFGERAVEAGLPPAADLASMEAVTFHRRSLDLAQAGSVLALDLPLLAGRYPWLVKEVEDGADGTRTLRGQLLDQAHVWPVMFTLGPSSVLATLHTPEGSIEIEAFGSVAWVVASSDFQVRARPHLRDWILPERSPGQPSRSL